MIAPRSESERLLLLAGKNSALHRKHGLYIDLVTVATIPEDYDQRLAEMPRGFRLRRVVQDDAEKLIECFIETFVDGIEFCDWSHEDICRHARRNITDYFAGNIKRRGAPLNVSVCALAEDDDALIAAALFTDHADAAELDLLMVRPRFRRRGLARAMVINAMNELHARDRLALRSAYVVCNEESAAWHKAFGFTELPDLGLARLCRSHFAVETGRCEADKSVRVEERERISREYDFWKRRASELEQVGERDGFDAVTPIRRFAW